MTARLGFIGTGHIAAAMVAGLCRAPEPPARIAVSPRNAETAARLAKQYRAVSVAKDNQAVIDASDLVILAVRPQDARAILEPLRFRAAQRVLSLIAPVADDWLEAAVAPARLVARALPLPPCEHRLGPVAFFPHEPEIEALLARIGAPIALADKRQFLAIWTLTALIATHYALLGRMADWATAHGAPADAARRYATAMTEALTAMASQPGAPALEAMAKAAMTPGGLNEQVRRELTQKDWFAAVDSALDGILGRLEGRGR